MKTRLRHGLWWAAVIAAVPLGVLTWTATWLNDRVDGLYESPHRWAYREKCAPKARRPGQ